MQICHNRNPVRIDLSEIAAIWFIDNIAIKTIILYKGSMIYYSASNSQHYLELFT